MGLAASQARFLCLTARKADCEYKSTALAQDKLDITEKMSQIANEYAQSMNATKLMWCPDGMAGDFGLSYGLLMTPSAANDYNPYMVTTPSGAIVLNSAFKAAADAAGISKVGGNGSQEQRDKFISALISQGVITNPTAKSITKNDFDATISEEDNSVILTSIDGNNEAIEWNSIAGLGDTGKLIKGGADAMDLSSLILSENIGQKKVDWSKLFIEDGQITKLEYQTELQRLKDLQNVEGKDGKIKEEVIAQLQSDLNKYKNTDPEYAEIEKLVNYAKKYYDETDPIFQSTNAAGENITLSKSQVQQKIRDQISKDITDYQNSTSVKAISLDKGINVSANSLIYSNNGNKNFSIVVNGVINHYETELENMTLGDILSKNVVLMANINDNNIEYKTEDGTTAYRKMEASDFANYAIKILNSLSSILGYSPTTDKQNQGLAVDDASRRALKYAYTMVKNIYLNPSQVESIGDRTNDHAMTENSAYINATTYNRISGDSSLTYYGVSLTNMMNAFLTYYENGLTGANSEYVVGKSVENSILVTDNSAYKYLVNDSYEDTPMDEKVADFYDKLYNNILEHGWRYDASIDDGEYLETVLKNGRYSMCSLNQDGYYYQTRYNETGYMVEVSDTDAIARAEAEFKAMKAELTFKEDEIDVKTKKLDAEIASISAEVDSVKNIITKSIEKTFTMFSS